MASKNARNWGIFGAVAAAGVALATWITFQHEKPELTNPPKQVAAWWAPCTEPVTWCGVTSGNHPIAVEYLRWAAGQWADHGYPVEVVVQARCPERPRWVTWQVDPDLDTEAGIGWSDIDGPLAFSDMDNGPENWDITTFPGLDITSDTTPRDHLGRAFLDVAGPPGVVVHPSAGRYTYLHAGGHTLGWDDWRKLPQSGHAMASGVGVKVGKDMRALDCVP